MQLLQSFIYSIKHSLSLVCLSAIYHLSVIAILSFKMCEGCAAVLDTVKKFLLEKVVRMKKPEAKIIGVEIEDVSRDGVTLKIKISVNNPHVRSLPISEISYTVNSADRFVAPLPVLYVFKSLYNIGSH